VLSILIAAPPVGFPAPAGLCEAVSSALECASPTMIAVLDEEGNKRILVAALECLEELLVATGSLIMHDDDTCAQYVDALVYFLEGKVSRIWSYELALRRWQE
jgi:ABC-type hemin transport system ATPase subunit